MIKTIRVQMLGGLRVTADGEELVGPGEEAGKAWQLFCFVLLNQGAPCTATRIAANLWPGLSPSSPVEGLSRAAAELDREFEVTRPEEAPIQLADGMYSRNPGMEFILDTEAFEAACQAASNADAQEQTALYSEAAALYTGPLLCGLGGEAWVAPLAHYFAKLYMECVSRLCDGLAAEGSHAQLLETATTAARLEPLEEQYHLYTFRALEALGMSRVIIPTYHRAARAFMEELGVPLGEEIRAIYQQASDRVDPVEQDVMIVRDDLLEAAGDSRPGGLGGPLFCSYDVFRYLYQVMARSCERAGRRVAVLLLSLQPVENGADAEAFAPSPRTVSALMNKIRALTLAGLLRRSDTMARFSRNQYIIMLSVDSREGADIVMERLREECAPLLAQSGMTLRFAPVDVEPPL